MQSEIEVIENTIVELDYIVSDSYKYPQLKIPNGQHNRIKNLLQSLRKYRDNHPNGKKKKSWIKSF